MANITASIVAGIHLPQVWALLVALLLLLAAEPKGSALLLPTKAPVLLPTALLPSTGLDLQDMAMTQHRLLQGMSICPGV